uniref:Uncharacterized protein n=1 Tax=Raphidiopteran tombus-related virus TaxID=2822559 RepID=A0A8A6RH41_9TOMB|nr:hypothetical protein [Raphidiopteran tombus-related virus]
MFRKAVSMVGLDSAGASTSQQAGAAEPDNPKPSKDASEENARLKAMIERRELEQQLALADLNHKEELIALLNIKTAGKLIDKNYKAYCTKLMIDYLDRIPITSPVIKQKCMRDVYEMHIYEKTKYREWTAAEIIKANESNENAQGVAYYRNPVLFFWWHKVELKQDLNSNSPLRQPDSTSWYHWIVPIAAAGIASVSLFYLGRYIISHLFSAPENSTITPPAPNPVMRPSTTVINQFFSPNMTPDSLPDSTSTLESSNVIQPSGLIKSMWTALKTALSGPVTNASCESLNKEEKLQTSLLLLQKLKSFQLPNIKPHDLYKLGISRSTLNTDVTLNLLNSSLARSIITNTTSAKEIMTKSLAGSISYASDTVIIRRQTILPSMHTLPSKCYALLTPSINRCIDTIGSFVDYQLRRLITTVKVDKVTTTVFEERECLVMLTLHLATASLTMLSLCAYWMNSASKVMPLSTAMIALFSLTNLYLLLR